MIARAMQVIMLLLLPWNLVSSSDQQTIENAFDEIQDKLKLYGLGQTFSSEKIHKALAKQDYDVDDALEILITKPVRKIKKALEKLQLGEMFSSKLIRSTLISHDYDVNESLCTLLTILENEDDKKAESNESADFQSDIQQITDIDTMSSLKDQQQAYNNQDPSFTYNSENQSIDNKQIWCEKLIEEFKPDFENVGVSDTDFKLLAEEIINVYKNGIMTYDDIKAVVGETWDSIKTSFNNITKNLAPLGLGTRFDSHDILFALLQNCNHEEQALEYLLQNLDNPSNKPIGTEEEDTEALQILMKGEDTRKIKSTTNSDNLTEADSLNVTDMKTSSGCDIAEMLQPGSTQRLLALDDDTESNVLNPQQQSKNQDINANTPFRVGSVLQKTQENIDSLLFAAGIGDSAMVAEMVLGQMVDVNSRDMSGNTALHQAAIGGHDDCLNLLLILGADVFALSSSGISVLSIYVRTIANRYKCGSMAGLQTLVDNGARPSTEDVEFLENASEKEDTTDLVKEAANYLKKQNE